MNEYTVIKEVLSSLMGSALKENNKSIIEWLSSKVQTSFPDLENDIMKWATDQAFYEDENYKPSELVKSYARKFYGPLEGDSPEQIQDLEKEFGTQGDNSDTGTPYQSREDVPESARDLWDIMHNDEAINSMRRGM